MSRESLSSCRSSHAFRARRAFPELGRHLLASSVRSPPSWSCLYFSLVSFPFSIFQPIYFTAVRYPTVLTNQERWPPLSWLHKKHGLNLKHGLCTKAEDLRTRCYVNTTFPKPPARTTTQSVVCFSCDQAFISNLLLTCRRQAHRPAPQGFPTTHHGLTRSVLMPWRSCGASFLQATLGRTSTASPLSWTCLFPSFSFLFSLVSFFFTYTPSSSPWPKLNRSELPTLDREERHLGKAPYG